MMVRPPRGPRWGWGGECKRSIAGRRRAAINHGRHDCRLSLLFVPPPPHPARPTVPSEAWRRNSSNTSVVDVQLSLYRPIFFDCDFSTRLRATLDGAFSSVVLCSVEY